MADAPKPAADQPESKGPRYYVGHVYRRLAALVDGIQHDHEVVDGTIDCAACAGQYRAPQVDTPLGDRAATNSALNPDAPAPAKAQLVPQFGPEPAQPPAAA